MSDSFHICCHAVNSTIDLLNERPQRQPAVTTAAIQQHPASQHAASNTQASSLPSQMASQAQHLSSRPGAGKPQHQTFPTAPVAPQPAAPAILQQPAVPQQTQSKAYVKPIVDRSPVSTEQVMRAATPAAAKGQTSSQAQYVPIALSRPADARPMSQPDAASVVSLQGHASSSAQPVQTNTVAHQPYKAEVAKSNAPGVSQESQATSAKIASLTQQIKQMKTKMIQYASLLDNPEWKQQQPDRGKAVGHPL